MSALLDARRELQKVSGCVEPLPSILISGIPNLMLVHYQQTVHIILYPPLSPHMSLQGTYMRLLCQRKCSAHLAIEK